MTIQLKTRENNIRQYKAIEGNSNTRQYKIRQIKIRQYKIRQDNTIQYKTI